MTISPFDANITELIHRSADGDPQSDSELYRAVYGELNNIAVGMLRRGHSNLTTTALVHECYLRISAWDTASIRDRKHFYATCAKAMRHIIVDEIRKSSSHKRSGVRVELDDGMFRRHGSQTALIQLDEALEDLKQEEPDIAEAIELCVFSGLDTKTIATLFETTPRTVQRWLKKGKAFVELRMV